MKYYVTILPLLFTLLLLPSLAAQAKTEAPPAKKNDAAPKAADNDTDDEEDADAAPKETTDLIERARKVLEHWYDQRRRALRDQHEFDSKEAWEAAAKKGDFNDYAAFEEAIAARRKADAKHFSRLYADMRAAAEKAHFAAVKEDARQKAQNTQ